VLQEKEENLRVQRKREERERWWAGAEVVRPTKNNRTTDVTVVNSQGEALVSTKDRQLSRYAMDYSKWNSWQPDDEVSRLESFEKEKEEEEKRNKEFEANNPDFCQQFMQDMETRKKATQQKQESADVLRLRGNRYFKNKDFSGALVAYMEALRSCPFDGKILLNIAQVHYFETCFLNSALSYLVSNYCRRISN
jgi:tetratricopeptide (TPR) repeat protein